MPASSKAKGGAAAISCKSPASGALPGAAAEGVGGGRDSALASAVEVAFVLFAGAGAGCGPLHASAADIARTRGVALHILGMVSRGDSSSNRKNRGGPAHVFTGGPTCEPSYPKGIDARGEHEHEGRVANTP